METTAPTTQFGLPGLDAHSDSIQQSEADTCAIKAQEIMMHGMGMDVEEAQLIQEAIDHGWYTPGEGTTIGDVGKLMELHGADVTPSQGASMYNLVSELSQGHPVLVGVDSGELWTPGADETFEDIIHGPQADHALLVSGVNFNDDFTSGTVNLIDPGTGDVCKEYPMEQFVDAWDDSDNFMLTIE